MYSKVFLLVGIIFAVKLNLSYEEECGISTGGPPMQLYSKNIGMPVGFNWDEKSKKLYFVQYYENKFCSLNSEKLCCINVPNVIEMSALYPLVNSNSTFEGLGRIGDACYIFYLNVTYGSDGCFTNALSSSVIPLTHCGYAIMTDSTVDTEGHLWFDLLSNVGRGYFYEMASPRKMIDWFTKLTMPTGIDVNCAKDAVFIADSAKNGGIMLFKSRNNGSMIFESKSYPGLPERVCHVLSTDGKEIWISFCDSGTLLLYNWQSHNIKNIISTPIRNITSITFGGPDHDTIFVGSGSLDPNSGEVYIIYNSNTKGCTKPRIMNYKK